MSAQKKFEELTPEQQDSVKGFSADIKRNIDAGVSDGVAMFTFLIWKELGIDLDTALNSIRGLETYTTSNNLPEKE